MFRRIASGVQRRYRRIAQRPEHLSKGISPLPHWYSIHWFFINAPIQIGDIGGLNFCFCFCFTAVSGLPLLAASCLAYRSFALRCWGVWACLLVSFQVGENESFVKYHAQPLGQTLPLGWRCCRMVFRVLGSRCSSLTRWKSNDLGCRWIETDFHLRYLPWLA